MGAKVIGGGTACLSLSLSLIDLSVSWASCIVRLLALAPTNSLASSYTGQDSRPESRTSCVRAQANADGKSSFCPLKPTVLLSDTQHRVSTSQCCSRVICLLYRHPAVWKTFSEVTCQFSTRV